MPLTTRQAFGFEFQKLLTVHSTEAKAHPSADKDADSTRGPRRKRAATTQPQAVGIGLLYTPKEVACRGEARGTRPCGAVVAPAARCIGVKARAACACGV